MPRAENKPVWRNADAHDRYMGRWSRQVAPTFLRWLAQPPALRWLDVGCGTGGLCAAVLARCAPVSVVGIDSCEVFLRKACEQLGDRVRLECAAVDALPLPDGAVDVTASALVMNFAADAMAAVTQMRRVTAVGGIVAAYVWDYTGRMDLIRMYWEAARAIDPAAHRHDTESSAAICHPDALATLFEHNGLVDVATTAIDIALPFATFDDYWQPFLGGQGCAPAHAISLSEPIRKQLREKLRELLPLRADESMVLSARAWAVRGVVRC